MKLSRFSFLISRFSSPGFTLVEVLVALSLLATALVPAFVLATNAVSLSARIRNTLISANLAQEGVEVVRAIRDANWFAGAPTTFDDGLTACTGGCAFQFDSVGPESGVPLGAPLQIDPTTGLYQYNCGSCEDTIFSRTVTIVQGSVADELVVKSTVEWMEKKVPKSVTVEYHLFDWIQ